MRLIRLLRTVILFPFLLPAFYILKIAGQYTGVMPLADILGSILFYGILSAACYFACTLIYKKDKLRAGIVAVAIMAVVLYWGDMILKLSISYRIRDNYWHYPFMIGIPLLLAVAIARIIRDTSLELRRKITIFLNGLLLIYVFIELAQMSYKSFRLIGAPPYVAAYPPALARTTRHTGENVYLLLMDEYEATHSLRSEWGLDNSNMDSFLTANGFKVCGQSTSNYPITHLSLASMFNMAYVDTAYWLQDSTIDETAYVRAQQWIEDSRMIHKFQEEGYRIVNCSPFFIAGREGLDVANFVGGRPGRILTMNTFIDRTRDHYLPYLKSYQQRHNGRPFRDPLLYNIDNYNRHAARKFTAEIYAEKRKFPVFVYAHFLMPHFPYYYDRNDRPLADSVIRRKSADKDPEAYFGNLLHANRLVKSSVTRILSTEAKKSIIIVLGDHGLRTDARKSHRNNLSFNYCAVYFPGQDYSRLPDSVSNVNMFRIVFNRIYGTSFPMLVNRKFTVRDKH